MSLSMTEKQKRDFETDGFIIIDPFFTPEELDRLLAAVDEVAGKVQEEFWKRFDF